MPVEIDGGVLNGMEEDIANIRPSIELRFTGNAPTFNPSIGELYFDTGTREYKVWNGTAWLTVSSGEPGFVQQPGEPVDDEYGVTVKRLKEIAMAEALKSDDTEIKEMLNRLFLHVKLKHGDTLKKQCHKENPRVRDDTLIGGEALSPFAIAGTYMGNSR